MPTGGGKSLTFQVPGLLLEGLTIVVTPLVALMKDQTDNLKRRHIQAVYFHSGQTIQERKRAWERLINNRAKFIYIAPERLKSKTFLNEIRSMRVSLIVVDEAHCISQWGYDFRPAYLTITQLRRMFPSAPLLALTATAPPAVRKDIMDRLEFRSDSNQYAMSFRRDNISYVVRDSQAKLSEILHILSRTQGSSIIYVRSRRKSKEIAEYLNNAGIGATFYHAGLDISEKETRQNSWINGEIRVIVATNAFGMGIDKPDVRLVIHYSMPPSLEEYYQEAGRAGRDGKPSFAVLLTAKQDKGTLRRNLTRQFPPREVVRNTYTRLCVFLGKAVGEGYNTINDFDPEKFAVTYGIEPYTVRASLGLLEKAGYIEFVEDSENSSRLMVTVEREELYNVKLHSEVNDRLLVAILRRYPGLFSDFVFISETTLCYETGLDSQTVYNALLELSRMKIIHYVPRRRTPSVIFTTAREEERYILIGKEIYEKRKEILSDRIERMIDYGFSSDGCRVERMLEYMGEESGEACGKCDICRDNRKARCTKEREESVKSRLLEMLDSQKNGLTLHQIQTLFGEDYRIASDLLRMLAEEEMVTFAEDRWRKT